MPRPCPTNNFHILDGACPGISGFTNAAPSSNSKTAARENCVSLQKWGQSDEILTAAYRRRRIGAEEEPDSPNLDSGCDDFESNVNELDGENLFDSIDKLLDRQEQVAKQKNGNKIRHCGGVEHRRRLQDDVATSQRDIDNCLSSFHGSFAGGEDETPTPLLIGISSPSVIKNSCETARQHYDNESNEEHEENNVQSTADPKRSAKQYSTMKTSTPRFTFQSSVKMKNSFQTPSHQQSLPQRKLFSVSSAPQKSSKLMQRHTFRKSFERETPFVSDVRQLDCTPSFLPRKRSKDPIKDGISHDFPHEDDSIPRGGSLFESFLKSNLKDFTPSIASRSSNAKSGYLIQRLRSLRNNEQRIAMRLRSGQYSNVFSSWTGAVMARKRRRGENDHVDSKHTSMSQLDVTISHLGIECAFGDDKSIHVAYIHRFEKNISFNHSRGDGIKLSLPCFSWIVLSNNVMRENGITDTIAKQLRFYDAVVIPTRSIIHSLPDSDFAESNSAMPTIICANVCEQYPADKPLQQISFDRFKKSEK